MQLTGIWGGVIHGPAARAQSEQSSPVQRCAYVSAFTAAANAEDAQQFMAAVIQSPRVLG